MRARTLAVAIFLRLARLETTIRLVVSRRGGRHDLAYNTGCHVGQPTGRALNEVFRRRGGFGPCPLDCVSGLADCFSHGCPSDEFLPLSSRLRVFRVRGRPGLSAYLHASRATARSNGIDQGWLKSCALLTPPPDGAGLCRAWLRERLAGAAADPARRSAVTVSTTASRMPNATFSHNESSAEADKVSDITRSLLLDLCPPRGT